MRDFDRFFKLYYYKELLAIEKEGLDINYILDLIKLLFYIDKRPNAIKIHRLYSETISNPILHKRRVIYMNDWGTNAGLADRLKGALLTYSLSKKFKRQFYIYWNHPFPLNDYLEPASFNWEIKKENIYYSKQHCFPLICSYKKKQTPIETFIKKIVLKILFRRRKELHVITNYLLFDDNYPQLFRELFKPTELLEYELKKYSHIRNYYSYTFRFQNLLGDFDEKYSYVSDIEDKEVLINKNFEELKKMLSDLPENYKALVTSDSLSFLERVKDIDERIFIIPGKIYHPSTFIAKMNECQNYPFLKSFLDFFMIMGAEKVYRLRTESMYPSGFPHLAAIIGGQPFIDHLF